MTNMFDYLTWRGDLTFSQVRPNPVDALIFSTLAYVFYGDKAKAEPGQAMTLGECAAEFFTLENPENRVRVKKDMELLRAAAATTRFGQTRLCMYENRFLPEQETQFAAMTFLLDDGTMFVVYRGTDNSLVGWKEDFNMSFKAHIASQLDAAKYLSNIAKKYRQKVRTGGHSKGGNLAVYAAAFADKAAKNKIINVYNNDGPGFIEEITDTKEYKEAIEKVHTYIPQSSVVGRLLNHEEKYTIVQSVQKGIMQHDLYSWQLEGKKLISLAEVTNGSQFVDKTLKEWLKGIDPKQREIVIDAIFEIINTTDANSFKEIREKLFTDVRLMLKKYQSLDDESKKMIMEFFQTLIRTAKNTAIEEIPTFGRNNKE